MFNLQNECFLYFIYKKDHKPSHRESVKNFRKITQTTFWDQNKIKLKINNKSTKNLHLES